MNQIDKVGCPFQIQIPAGTSTFEIQVPRIFCDRKFYFSKLSLVPEYFSQQAYLYNQDLEEELESSVSGYHMYATLRFDRDTLYPVTNVYDQNATTARKINTFLKEINDFFEVQRPAGVTRSPLFFDWIDTLFADSEDDYTMYVTNLAATYYDEEEFSERHLNFVPPSVRTLPRVNNTLYPENVQPEEIADRIRIRLHLAPEMKAVFSTDAQLKAMGFTPEDYGKRVGRNQFIIENKSYDWLVLEASEPPFGNYIWTTPLTKLYVQPTGNQWLSRVEEFQNLTIEDDKKNASVAKEMEKAVKQISETSNWNFSFVFDATENKFKFGFPNNENVRATLYVTEALALRLGYGMTRSIEATSIPQAKLEIKDVQESSKMALALVYDTGLTIVSIKDSSSNTTSNIDNQFMASMEPESPGILRMNPCDTTVSAYVPYHKTGSGPWANIKFELFRFNEQGLPVPFAWTIMSKMNGVLTSD